MALRDDERKLVEGCRLGDEKAWLALYRAYAGDVGTFFKGMLRYSNDVDDLVQKVFLEFLSSLDRFRGDASIRTWLHRIARHVALHDLRSRKRRNHYVHAYAETVEQAEKSADGQVSARHHLNLIHGLLENIKEEFREVWVLREVMGFSVEESAAILEIEEATVRSRHHRARQKLFNLLEKLNASDAHLLGEPRGHLKLVTTKGTHS